MATTTVGVPSRCGNGGCGEVGKLKCTACQSINYCSAECQKVHWASHKVACKQAREKNVAVNGIVTSSSSSSLSVKGSTSSRNTIASPAADDSKAVLQKLQSSKENVQRHFQQGDFKSAATLGEEALILARKLPPQVGLTEIIQLHMNLASAYMELKTFSEAETHCLSAIQLAEMVVRQNPHHPPAIEMLSMTMGTRCLLLLHTDRFDAAEEVAKQSYSLAESIYHKTDPRLCKSLKINALVLEKQGKLVEAERSLFRCYTILCVTPGVGVENRETQTFFEELLNVVLRRGDDSAAERYALSNFKSIKEKDAGKEEIALGDASARLGFMYSRTGKFSEAEPLIAKALEIREKVLGMGHIGIAYTLAQLVSVHDKLGWYGDDQEAMLKRALEIFSRSQGGQHAQELQNTIAQLRHMRSRRGQQEKLGVNSVEVEDVEDVFVTGESRNGGNNGSDETKSVSPNSRRSQGSSPMSRNNLSLMEKKPVFSFEAGDAVGRMTAAGALFEQGRFNWAEELLKEAFDIFLKTHGPQHNNTKAAKQNLQVARQNALNQLWTQVVTEEVLALDDNSPSPTPTAVEANAASSVSSTSKYTADETKGINEYEKILQMHAAQQKQSAPSSCIVC